MNYEKLIETISEMVSNPKIETNGLSLTYELDSKSHFEINKELYYKINPIALPFTHIDVFEVELGGILVKFIEKNG